LPVQFDTEKENHSMRTCPVIVSHFVASASQLLEGLY